MKKKTRIIVTWIIIAVMMAGILASVVTALVSGQYMSM